MSDYLYYCAKCNSLIADSYEDDEIACESCGAKMTPLHIDEDDWDEMTDDEKMSLLEKYRNPRPQVQKKRPVSSGYIGGSEANNTQRTKKVTNTQQSYSGYNSGAKDYYDRISGMSIVAFILSLLGCLGIVGLILGIIDLTKNDGRKRGLSIAAVVIGALMLIGSAAIGVNSGKDKSIVSVSKATSESPSDTVNDSIDETATPEDENTVPKEDANSSEQVEKHEEQEEQQNEQEEKIIAIDEQVLFEGNDIKITATGLEDSWAGTKLALLIENNSNRGITVQCRNANVNGYMVDTMMSADVAAGKKANDGLTFETKGLKECGIKQIATMEFYFHIFDADSWDEIVDTDVIRVNTAIADSYVQEVDDSGEILVDSNGVKIVGKGLSEKDSFWGPGVILYVENNTDQDITIQVRDVSVNGFMVDSSMSEDVAAGKKAISDVQFFSTDLEKNNITEVKDVELYFHIFDQDSWDEVFDSDVITISF